MIRPRRTGLVGMALCAVLVAGGCAEARDDVRTPAGQPPSGTPTASPPSVIPSPTGPLGAGSGQPPAPAKPAEQAPGKLPPAAGDPPVAGPYHYVFPVAGKASFAHRNAHAGYPATDIMAACGLTVRAVTNGVVLEVDRVDDYDKKVDDGAERGGKSVSILGDDGVRYYTSHFSSIAGGIQPGVRVTAGQKIAEVGTTGLSSACHVHFGISPPCARTGDWWVRRGVIWPWRYLDGWRDGIAASAVNQVRQWQSSNGCPSKPPQDA